MQLTHISAQVLRNNSNTSLQALKQKRTEVNSDHVCFVHPSTDMSVDMHKTHMIQKLRGSHITSHFVAFVLRFRRNVWLPPGFDHFQQS